MSTRRRPYSRGLICDYEPSCGPSFEALPLRCVTSNSNPASSLHWEAGGSSLEATSNTSVSPASAGGWVSASTTSLTIGPNDKTKTVSCYAKNSALGETKVETHIVTVLREYLLSIWIVTCVIRKFHSYDTYFMFFSFLKSLILTRQKQHNLGLPYFSHFPLFPSILVISSPDLIQGEHIDTDYPNSEH